MKIKSDETLLEDPFLAHSNFIRPILDGLEALCAIINVDGEIVLVNRAWHQFTIDNGGDLNLVWEGQNYLSACQPENAGVMSDGKSVAQAIQEVLDGKSLSFEIVNTCHSLAEKRWYLQRVTRFCIEEAVYGFVNHENVTRAVLEEREQQDASRIEALGILAGGIAHDLNNLITVQISNLQLAKLKLEQDRQILPNLNAVLASLDQASNLSEQLLTFSDGGDPIFELLNINSLVKDAITFSLSGSNIKAHVQLPNEAYFLYGDKRQLLQVFSNLVVNAREAMPSGGNLYVDMIPNNEEFNEEFDGNHKRYTSIEISVRDDGVGISEDVLNKMFSPFFTTKDFGHGLGLAIIKSIVNKHKGRVTVESEVGVGSKFSIQLPIVETDNTLVQDEPVVTEIERLTNSAFILVMDDDEAIQSALKDMLDFYEYDSIITADGDQAVDAYIAQYNLGKPFDLVLMDLTIIGGMGGVEAVTHILKFDPHAKVIASSGYANNNVLSEFQKYGFVDILSKPYPMDALIEKINKWVS